MPKVILTKVLSQKKAGQVEPFLSKVCSSTKTISCRCPPKMHDPKNLRCMQWSRKTIPVIFLLGEY